MNAFQKNIGGTLLMSVGAVLFAQVLASEPAVSTQVGSLARVSINLLVSVLLYHALGLQHPGTGLWGKQRKMLIVWGLLGSLTIISFFCSLSRSGVGSATFLLSTSGAFLILFQALTQRRAPSYIQLGIAGVCLVGASLVSATDATLLANPGLWWGLLSGCAAAAAYTLVGEHIRDESTFSMMFYWSAVNLVVHLLWLSTGSFRWPEKGSSWVYLGASGLIAALGQYWVTASFQIKDNARVGLIGYLGGVFSMAMQIIFLGQSFTVLQCLGAALMMTPLLTKGLMGRRQGALLGN